MARKESANDIVLLKNIDTMCSDVAVDQYKQYVPIQMADGKTQSRERDAFKEYKHSDFFQVRWDNNPQRVKPGDTVLMVRYIASHFAKHLIDHLLTKKELQSGKQNLIANQAERDKLMAQIIVGVQTYYEPDTEPENEEHIATYEPVGEDMGETPGDLEEPMDVQDKAEEMPSNVSFSGLNQPGASKTIHQLRAEARQLGLEVLPTDKKTDLIAKITAF